MSPVLSFWLGLLIVAICACGALIGGNFVKSNWGYWNTPTKSEGIQINNDSIEQIANKTAKETLAQIYNKSK